MIIAPPPINRGKIQYPDIGKYYFKVYELTLVSFLVASFVGIFPIMAKSNLGLSYFLTNAIFLYFPLYINFEIYKHSVLNETIFGKEGLLSKILLLCSFLNLFVTVSLFDEIVPIFENPLNGLSDFYGYFFKTAFLYPTFLFAFVVAYTTLKWYLMEKEYKVSFRLSCFPEIFFMLPVYAYFFYMIGAHPKEWIFKILSFTSIRVNERWDSFLITLYVIILIVGLILRFRHNKWWGLENLKKWKRKSEENSSTKKKRK